MQQLPRGYYAVQSDFENAPRDRFTFRGVTYAVCEGVNLFSSLSAANEHASEVPEVVLGDLPYESFPTPVLLFSAGRHCVDKFSFTRSLTLLGEGAGISPNLPAENPLEPPTLSPARAEGESVLWGSFWHGHMTLAETAVKTLVVDGFSSANLRFRDIRPDGGSVYVAFRNIIHTSPCGRTLYHFATPAPGSTLDREVLLRNIRVVDFDDLDYGANFALLNARRATLDGICCDNSTQVFGLTSISRDFSNCTGFDTSEYIIKNSYFRNLQGENGISTGCRDAGERAVRLTVADSVFVNAGRENEAVLRPHLANDKCRLYVFNCTFVDSRGNSRPAISVMGPGTNVEISDCTFEGFAGVWSSEPAIPTRAPDYILARECVTTTADPHRVIGEADFSALDALYEGTKAYYGDLHVHTDCGGTSDGSLPMSEWPAKMDEKKLDFAAVVDHRQMRGFFLLEWDEERFIIGTEPGTAILDLNACRHNHRSVHYNMLFPHKYGLAMVLANFPEFEFRGDELTGSFIYPKFTKERFFELTSYVQSIGGIMVHPHPKTLLSSDDPLDYYFGEYTFIETIYGNYSTHASFRNYDLWVALLALGKRVYASGGSDTHGAVSNSAVSTFYTKEKSGSAFFSQMRSGNFTVGAVGIKMCIDRYPMGSEVAYREGMELTLRLDDFYPPAWQKDTAYELRIYTDRGLAYALTYSGKLPQAVALQVKKRAFYRAEVYDLTHGCRVAVGNPVWMD